MRHAEIQVDLDAIRANVARLRAATTAEVMTVVKADAYGHGALPVARAAVRAGASWLGVCTLDEALALRAGGITAPVLAWLLVPGLPLHRGVEAGIDLSTSSTGLLAELVEAARTAGRPAHVHLKIDTSLNPVGPKPGNWLLLTAAASNASAHCRIQAS